MTRPLPIPVQLSTDESWRSYLNRVAKVYCCTAETLGGHLGLRPNRRWPASHGITLDPALTEHVATQLALPPNQITEMHPARWDGRALQISAITKQTPHAWPIVPINWTYLRQPRTCEACVTQYGYQRMTWHLPWVTHCVEHSVQLHELAEIRNNPGDGARRTALLLNLLNTPTAVFAGQEVPSETALRAWLECTILIAAAQHPDWRTPPTAHTAHRWLSSAETIAAVGTAHQAEALLKPIIRNPQISAGRYAQASLYSPPMRNPVDSINARWNRASPPKPHLTDTTRIALKMEGPR